MRLKYSTMKTNNNIVKIMGIDPGLNSTGINISSYDISTGILTVNTFMLIQANNIAKKELKEDSKVYGNIVSLDVYEREIDAILSKYMPDYICCEDAFYNPKMPNAFLSLKLCITTIRRLLYHKYNKLLYTIAPKAAKQCVATGTANKLAVQDAIRNLPDLIIKSTKKHNVDNMSSHEADATAISYAFVKLYLPDLILQK